MIPVAEVVNTCYYIYLSQKQKSTGHLITSICLSSLHSIIFIGFRPNILGDMSADSNVFLQLTNKL